MLAVAALPAVAAVFCVDCSMVFVFGVAVGWGVRWFSGMNRGEDEEMAR